MRPLLRHQSLRLYSSTYRELVVDIRFPGYAFEHAGFEGQEFEAVQAFATYYGLDAEITPLFSPELGNPLFLHLACKTLRDEGRTSLDISLPGIVALLEGHLKHCDVLVRGRLAYSNPRNVVRAAMLRLSEVLTHNVPQERTWEACTAELQRLVGAEFAAEALLKELEQTRALSFCLQANGTRGSFGWGTNVMATSCEPSVSFKDSTGPGGLDLAALASKLATLTPDDEGLLDTLAAVLPEKSG